jgi:hypothetical protein
MNDSKMYAVDAGYAYGGVIVEDGKVISAPPIFKWMIGKEWGQVLTWRKILNVAEVVGEAESRDIPLE